MSGLLDLRLDADVVVFCVRLFVDGSRTTLHVLRCWEHANFVARLASFSSLTAVVPIAGAARH